MKRLASLVPLFALFAAASAGAQAPARPDSPQQMKARLIEHIDAKIRILQEARGCVEKASSMGAVAVCHDRERKQTKALRRQAR